MTTFALGAPPSVGLSLLMACGLEGYLHTFYAEERDGSLARRATCPRSPSSPTWKEAVLAEKVLVDGPDCSMAAIPNTFSAPVQQVARDLAPFIPWLPTPQQGWAQSDSWVKAPFPSLLCLGFSWARERRGWISGIPSPCPLAQGLPCAQGGQSYLIGACSHPGDRPREGLLW